ncbi:MAG: hypothetical protein RLZZ245_3915 [Verrucomicrobiota bacterium]
MSFPYPTHRSVLELPRIPVVPEIFPQSGVSGRRSVDIHDSTVSESVPIIAICHLSWDWVWQRPQQFLSRLALTHPLLFVQTHCTEIEESCVKVRRSEQSADITILEIHLPASRWHEGGFIDAERRRVLQEAMGSILEHRFDRAILWINDPMAVTAYVGHLGERMLVYDCMDELTQFVGAPPELEAREKELTRLADVIFCGGRKMRDKRLPLNPNTHFYGTGVDCDHFGTAMDHELAVHPDIQRLTGSVIGFFGVIDERIDYQLIEFLADWDPDWHIVMLGPFAKIDPAGLPQRPNLHWLGPQTYEDLPSFTKGMDVCIMPFAINDATEYINPTKALEYMAAGKPVVATALDEVRSNFSGSCDIAESDEEFAAMCRLAILCPPRGSIRRGLTLAAASTWEATVVKMEGHMNDVLAGSVRSISCAPVKNPHPSTQEAYV